MEFIAKNKKKIGILLEEEIIDELVVVSKQHGLSKSEIINQILFNFFGLNKKRRGGKKSYETEEPYENENGLI